jgi:aspartyl-tRNA(Asn)/glutamyl-tRNA(Gln) amidotransferase subunit A
MSAPAPLGERVPSLEQARSAAAAAWEQASKAQERLSPFARMFERERALAGWKPGPLLFASAKDNLCVRGEETTAGSRILAGYRPPMTATALARLQEWGAVLLGHTAMDEFGFGTFGTSGATGSPKNPWDQERVCGGSSAGAACAAAALDSHVAVSESTGGSISCPAAWCGVVGLTPTYGRVSRWGLIDYANSLDKIGVISASPGAAFAALRIMGGPDENDMTSRSPENRMFARRTVERAVVPKELLSGVDRPVREAFEKAVEKVRDAGIRVDTGSFPTANLAVAAYYIIACAEASTNLARYSGVRFGARGERFADHFDRFAGRVRTAGFGQEAKRRIILGTFARMAGYRDRYYARALQARSLISAGLRSLLGLADDTVLLAPTMPVLAPRAAETAKLRPEQVYALDRLTIPPNLAGLPHLSMPCGLAGGLPVGLQAIAPHWGEGLLEDLALRMGPSLGAPRPPAARGGAG